jgi:hypothetical protein
MNGRYKSCAKMLEKKINLLCLLKDAREKKINLLCCNDMINLEE